VHVSRLPSQLRPHPVLDEIGWTDLDELNELDDENSNVFRRPSRCFCYQLRRFQPELEYGRWPSPGLTEVTSRPTAQTPTFDGLRLPLKLIVSTLETDCILT
jgi:hypothetical protein